MAVGALGDLVVPAVGSAVVVRWADMTDEEAAEYVDERRAQRRIEAAEEERDHTRADVTPAPARGLRLLVTGSRDWDDRQRLYDALDAAAGQHEVTLVHGACPSGADLMAAEWAGCTGHVVQAFPADWKTHGKVAGLLRNQVMVDAGADLCLAFVRAGSAGASHCAARAGHAGIPVRYYRA